MRAGGTPLTNGSVVASNSRTTRSKGKNLPVTTATLTLSSRQLLINNVSGDGTVVERNWGRGGRVSRTRERVGKQVLESYQPPRQMRSTQEELLKVKESKRRWELEEQRLQGRRAERTRAHWG